MSASQVLPVPATPERLLRLQEIQRAAGVSRVTVWRWCNERGLRTIRVGGCVRVRESDWLAWLAQHAADNGTGGDI
jgi:excisionase family DNA binding protein